MKTSKRKNPKERDSLMEHCIRSWIDTPNQNVSNQLFTEEKDLLCILIENNGEKPNNSILNENIGWFRRVMKEENYYRCELEGKWGYYVSLK